MYGLEMLFLPLSFILLILFIVFLLKVPVKTCMTRIEKRGNKKELFEEEKKLNVIWKTYNKLALKHNNTHIIDATKTINEVHEKIWQIAKQELQLSN